MFEFVIANVEQRTKGDLLMGFQKLLHTSYAFRMHACQFLSCKTLPIAILHITKITVIISKFTEI